MASWVALRRRVAFGLLLVSTTLVQTVAPEAFVLQALLLDLPVLVIAGLGFKISAVPFHMWTPDVYEGAPTPVTAFFASAPKVAAMALMMRVVIDAMGPAVGAWQQIIIFLALASIILGAVGAIGQKNIKRLLAYSSINNVGFMLIGLAAGTQAGIEGVLTYLLVYVVTTLGAFLVVLQLRDADGNQIESIPALAGLSQRRPGLAGRRRASRSPRRLRRPAAAGQRARQLPLYRDHQDDVFR